MPLGEERALELDTPTHLSLLGRADGQSTSPGLMCEASGSGLAL